MAKITKRVVDALQPEPHRDVFAWDTELRGFGIRVKPSGVKTFFIQYRNTEGRTLRALLGHAARLGVTGSNPAEGVRQLAVGRRKRRLSEDELRHLGRVMREAVAEGEHPTGLSAIRLMLLSGFGRMEALGLKRPWFNRNDHCVRFPDTKSGAQVRVLGEVAMDCIEAQTTREGSLFVFPADWGDGHFIGVVRVLQRICRKAKLEDVTPHVLRHTFASVAGDLGFSELTIADLLGHSARGVTQNYVHLDTALIVAANRVSMEIAILLDGGVSVKSRAIVTPCGVVFASNSDPVVAMPVSLPFEPMSALGRAGGGDRRGAHWADTTGVFRAAPGDQGDLAGFAGIAHDGAQGGALRQDRVQVRT
jgi:integrase